MIFFLMPKLNYLAMKYKRCLLIRLDPDFRRDDMRYKRCLRTRLDPGFRRDDMRYKRCLYLMSIVQSACVHNRLHITLCAQDHQQIAHHCGFTLIIEMHNIFIT